MARPKNGQPWPYECAWPPGSFEIHDEVSFDIDYAVLEFRLLALEKLGIPADLLYGDIDMKPNPHYSFSISNFHISDPAHPRLGDLAIGEYFRFNSGRNVYLVTMIGRQRMCYVQLTTGKTWDTAKSTISHQGVTPESRVTRLIPTGMSFEAAR